MNNLRDIATDWIADKFDQSDYDDFDIFVHDLTKYFVENADHISECFNDTGWWAEGEVFSQDELEEEIIRQVTQLNN